MTRGDLGDRVFGDEMGSEVFFLVAGWGSAAGVCRVDKFGRWGGGRMCV